MVILLIPIILYHVLTFFSIQIYKYFFDAFLLVVKLEHLIVIGFDVEVVEVSKILINKSEIIHCTYFLAIVSIFIKYEFKVSNYILTVAVIVIVESVLCRINLAFSWKLSKHREIELISTIIYVCFRMTISKTIHTDNIDCVKIHI